MKADLTDITVVCDRSGSMETIRADMCGGFDAFIRKQREVPGRCEVTLYQFDDVFEPVYVRRDVRDVPPLNLVPRASTALHDAVAKAITLTGERLAAMPPESRPGKVIVVVVTDGMENASRRYTGHDVAQMVRHQREKYAWEFVFLGANQDAIASAAAVGVTRNAATYQASKVGVAAAWSALSAGVGNYRSEVCTAGEIMSQASYDAAYADLSTGPSGGVAPVIAPVLPIEPPPPSTPGGKP